jgi:hypothetical protein
LSAAPKWLGKFIDGLTDEEICAFNAVCAVAATLAGLENYARLSNPKLAPIAAALVRSYAASQDLDLGAYADWWATKGERGNAWWRSILNPEPTHAPSGGLQ